MGSIGSGNRYRSGSKATEENFWRFSIATLKQFKVIGEKKWSSGSWRWLRFSEVRCSVGYELNTLQEPAWLRVQYSDKRSEKPYDYKIYLTTTEPHYGGTRWWFLCPAKACGKRVGVLYLGDIFACRHCRNLAYASQNEAPHFRLLSKAQAIHQQLGGDGVVDHRPYKPKGMHWKTYWRKVQAMERVHDAALMEAALRLGIEV